MEPDLPLLIVADDPLVRAGLALLLADAPDCIVVGQIDSDALLQHEPTAVEVAESGAELLVWDVGWQVDTELPDFAELPVPVVALVNSGEQATAAWAAGARGILTRDMDLDKLATAVQAAAQGLYVVDPALAPRLLPTADSSNETPGETLTPREIEVLQLLAEGLTNKAIARRLAISEHTVKFHVNALLGKLNAQSRTEAVVRATRLGLISL